MHGDNNEINAIPAPEEAVKTTASSGAISYIANKNNTKYFFILAALLLIVVGLVVAIDIVNNRNSMDGNGEGLPSENELSFEEMINSTATEMLYANNSVENIMKYFDDKIAEEKDKEKAFWIDSVRINYLIKNNYLELAISYLDIITNESLNDEQTWTIYNYYQTAYNALGDNQKSAEYADRAEVLLNKLQEKL